MLLENEWKQLTPLPSRLSSPNDIRNVAFRENDPAARRPYRIAVHQLPRPRSFIPHDAKSAAFLVFLGHDLDRYLICPPVVLRCTRALACLILVVSLAP